MSKELKTGTDLSDTISDHTKAEKEPTLDVYKAATVRAAYKNGPKTIDFYTHHPVGRFMVEYRLKTPPVLKEKLLLEKKLVELQERFLRSGIVNNEAAAEKKAQAEPDFQPKTESQIILDIFIDLAIEKVAINAVYSDQYEDLAKFDFRSEVEQKLNNFRYTTKLAALRAVFPEQLKERQYIFLRDTFLNFLSKQDFQHMLNILYRFYDNPSWNSATFEAGNLAVGSYVRFPGLQKVATQFLIQKLVLSGEESFNKFAEFLEQCGLSLAENKLEYANQDFVSRQLEILWKHCPHRYYEVIELLLYYGLTTAENLAKDSRVKLRTMQFLLYSFRIGKFSLAREKAIFTITEELKLYSSENLSFPQSRVLWLQYCQACHNEGVIVDAALDKMYRQPRINRFEDDYDNDDEEEE